MTINYMRIEKKVRHEYFRAAAEGRKRFEVRLADFRCRPGDTLVLKEQRKGSRELTGKSMECEVLYKFNTKEMERFHTKEEIEKHGLVVLAIRKRFR
jgi:ASC-1-like (ASCH) protein